MTKKDIQGISQVAPFCGGCPVVSWAFYENDPLVIETRMKPGYPGELFPREDIEKTVETRWNHYFGK
ncbi:hypothetical protein P4H39_16885 [Paenibacillus lautus]|uniref:hypothetical protein n=1 Tax=Paenibacillus lautus TaxID=1401 RepID=UPI002DBAF99F|nr:hypothetical protein [Paenibacillus lautus]MEC0204307.1 hypothetical protein [Paenibacillus lautus]